MIAWQPYTHDDRERSNDTRQRSHKKDERLRCRWKEAVETCMTQPAYFDSEALAALTQDILTQSSNNDEHGVAGIFDREVWSIRTTKTPDLRGRFWLNLALSYCVVLKKQSQNAKSREEVDKLKERIESALSPSKRSETSRNRLCRGSLVLHATINSLVVNQSRKLGEATILVLQYGPHSKSHYEKITDKSCRCLCEKLKTKAISGDCIARLDEICIAKMLVELDPSLPSSVSLESIHEYLGYSFVCSTCFPQSQPEPAGEVAAHARSPVGNYRIIASTPLQYFGSSNDPFGHLLSAIKVYFEDTCENDVYLAPDGTLLTPSGTKLHSDLAIFDSCCYSATIFQKQNMPVKFRGALTKACGLVRGILEARHPRTLACFFEVFLHLIQSGLSDVAQVLRNFVKEAAGVFVASNHLLRAICGFLAELDLDSLHETISRAWECTVNTFKRKLGPECPLTIAVRLDYIKRVHGAQNFAEEERLLRELLPATRAVPHVSGPRIMLNLAHNLNRQERYVEAGGLGNEVLKLLQQQEMYAEKIVERIEARKVIAKSCYGQGLFADAEWTMRVAIDVVVQTWGQEHAWVSEFRIVLESWLRAWGREAEADMLHDQIVYPTD